MTLKPSLRARVTDELLEEIRARTKRERREIGEAMNRVVAAWGQPHSHSGIGIRRLTTTIYECRVGLDERLAFVFLATPPELVLCFLGNHDRIQKFIRTNR
ncbi:MAG: hypothetical protein NTW21_15435 [Verrucomicrobia bacterium]|nr:hypothetical protein [Verrucomicrobiota bacterium]